MSSPRFTVVKGRGSRGPAGPPAPAVFDPYSPFCAPLTPGHGDRIATAQASWRNHLLSQLAAPGGAPLFTQPTILIVRGLSGSGKSSLCRVLLEEAAAYAGLPPPAAGATSVPGVAVVASADTFFMSPKGRYEFRVEGLRAAHASSRSTFDAALSSRTPLVVLDNTNVSKGEYAPYVLAALSLNDAVGEGRVRGVLPVAPGAAGAAPARSPAPPASTSSASPNSKGWAALGFRPSEEYISSWSDPTFPPPNEQRTVDRALHSAAPVLPGQYRVLVVELAAPRDEATMRRLAGRNVHGVPHDKILAMLELWRKENKGVGAAAAGGAQ